jgi:predicted SprT family Zn-dependent metalloprotease
MVLETIFRELNEAHFGSGLPPPLLRWNSRLSSTAGRFCPGSRIRLRPAVIEVAAYLRELADGEMHVRDTVLHEMIHYYLWHSGKPYGHTEEFHRILRKVGAKRYNPVPKIRPYKHWYECPGCRKRVPTRRKINGSACMDCCKTHSNGYYDRRFRLVLVENVKEEESCVEPIPIEAPLPTPPPRPREEPKLPPSEIIRRLEEIKQMLLRKTSTKA